ncbi:MAG: RHS repeat-associated core domain-containing protein [Bacteroidales bacterium]|nr:RHS repeat-associated core domain-containing protein [Bacteroidales bacterium]
MRSELNTGKLDAPGWVGTPHGRFVLDGTWKNEFHLRDHLGNTRIALLETGSDSLAILQQNHYYPFGMLIPSLSTSNTIGALKDNRYLYNSKELQDDFDLNWYVYPVFIGNYGVKFYDPQIGRFHSVDPLTEKNHRNTPYLYAANNPIRYIDWFGLDSLNAAALTQAAQNAVSWVKTNYGSTSAQCNRGVTKAFEELTQNNELAEKNANEMVDQMANSENFEVVNQDDVQSEANDGAIIIAGKKEDSGSGHVALAVPGIEVTSTNWGGTAPVGMDTGKNKRWSSKGMNYSWSSPTGVTFYKYKGASTGTINNQTYSGGTLSSVTVSASGSSYLTPRPAVVIPKRR